LLLVASSGQLTVLATGGNLHVYDVSAGCLGPASGRCLMRSG